MQYVLFSPCHTLFNIFYVVLNGPCITNVCVKLGGPVKYVLGWWAIHSSHPGLNMLNVGRIKSKGPTQPLTVTMKIQQYNSEMADVPHSLS